MLIPLIVIMRMTNFIALKFIVWRPSYPWEREWGGDLKVPVSFGSKLNHEAFSYCTFLRSLSFLFEITPTHCLFICKGFFTPPPSSSPKGEIICLSPLSTPHITSTNTETNTQRSNYKYMQLLYFTRKNQRFVFHSYQHLISQVQIQKQMYKKKDTNTKPYIVFH